MLKLIGVDTAEEYAWLDFNYANLFWWNGLTMNALEPNCTSRHGDYMSKGIWFTWWTRHLKGILMLMRLANIWRLVFYAHKRSQTTGHQCLLWWECWQERWMWMKKLYQDQGWCRSLRLWRVLRVIYHIRVRLARESKIIHRESKICYRHPRTQLWHMPLCLTLRYMIGVIELLAFWGLHERAICFLFDPLVVHLSF